MKNKDLQLRWLYPAKLSFKIEGQIKSFSDKKKLKDSILTKPLLYEMLCEKIKNMDNKMTTNTYVSTIESKKTKKQNRNRILDTENILMVDR